MKINLQVLLIVQLRIHIKKFHLLQISRFILILMLLQQYLGTIWRNWSNRYKKAEGKTQKIANQHISDSKIKKKYLLT